MMTDWLKRPRDGNASLAAGVATSPMAANAVLLGFLVLVAVAGGGSRADIASLIVLRPLAVLMACYALMVMPRDALRPVRAQLILIAAAAATIGGHLLPLPPGIWQLLPGRDIIAELDKVFAVGDIWRPASLAPAKTWNALFALSVPLAAIVLYAAIAPSDRRRIPSVLLGLGVVSSILGLAQLVAGPFSPLYTYAVTNGGVPTGLFANGNHQAVFLACLITIAAFWATTGRQPSHSRLVVAALLAMLFLLVVFLTGSRAGLALAIPAMLVAGLALGRAAMRATMSAKTKAEGRKIRYLAVAGAGVFVILLAAGAFACASGSCPIGLGVPAASEEMRLLALPTIIEMLGKFWLFGSGGGSFEAVYRIFEPTELLSRYYLNHAHNDWLEVAIEYGVAGMALLLALSIWAVRAARRGWSAQALDWSSRLALIAPPFMLALASLLDYPLRTPLMGAFLALWLMFMADAGGLMLGDKRARR